MKNIGFIATSLVLISSAATALPPDGRFTVTAKFTPAIVPAGTGTTFAWTAPGDAYCTVDGLPGGTRESMGSGNFPFTPSADTTVNVSCERGDFFAGKSATVRVTGLVVPTVYSSFSPSTVYVNSNGNTSNGSYFTWTSSNAIGCSAPGMPSMGTSGSHWITAATFPAQQFFTITCSSANASASSNAMLNTIAEPVGPLPTVSVVASPSVLARPGLYTNITYTATNHTSCVGGGRQRVYESTEFEVTCTGPGGSATGFAWVEVRDRGHIPFFAQASAANAEGRPLAAKRAGVADLKGLGIDLSKKRYVHVESDFNRDGAPDVLVYDQLSSKLHVVMGKDGKFPALSRTIDNVRSITQVKGVLVPASNAPAEIRVTLESQQ